MKVKCRSSSIATVQFKRQLAVSTTLSTTPSQTNQNGQEHGPSQKMDIAFPLGRLRASVASLELTRFDNFFLTHSFCSNGLKISAKKCFLPEGKQLHAHVMKLGFYDVLSLQNQLLNVYIKCKEYYDAFNLFDEMPVRNVITWNTLIWGVADYVGPSLKSNIHLGFQYFKRMLLEMVSPDCITFTSLLRTCIRLSDIMVGRQVHCFIMKMGLYEDCFVSCALVDLYGKFGLVGDARCVFDKISERDLVSWNVMVSCYALNCLAREAFEVFSLMRLEGVKADEFTFTNLLNSCTILGFCELGRQIHGLVVRLSFDLDVVVASTLVDMYAKNEHIVEARMTFDGMIFRNVISWNTMIVAYGQWGDGKDAMKLLREMFRACFGPDEVTLASVLSSCGNLSSATETVQIHAYEIKKGFQDFLSIANSLINAYSKCGSISKALKCFSSIADPDIVSWTSMIGAYAFHGLSNEGIELFEKMLSSSMMPDRVTFLAVLSACSHGALVHEGLHYFNLMTKTYHISPYSEHYTCLIDLLGRAGLLDEAFNVFTSMPIEPRSDTLGAFIGACKVHGNAGLAKWAAEKLFVLEPYKPVNYALMSNIYASVGCWLDVARVRKMLRDRCNYKVPGCSWVEIAGDVHIFVSSDKSHPRALEVYALLEGLVRPMEEEEDSVSTVDFMFDSV
ncbi:hypothetical protein F0562_019251 [Nyssa sinensis]|uniref:DYW domain-containing protein n=1 Tax=Nyssa sinensis TaxID=561372 RepID=A0A5J4ZEK9_9ASTE|nr:hypothetical protein F0562_019251 [Nyssa sinensis]